MRRFLLVAAVAAAVPVAVAASFAGCSDNTYIPIPVYEASVPDAPPVDFESGFGEDADAGPPPADGAPDGATDALSDGASDAPSDAPPSDGQTDSPASDAAGD